MNQSLSAIDAKRFGFGDNWARFLTNLTEERIKVAEQSLLTYLKVDNLQGKKFLDIGSGSGLFSLAARRLGATVFSFDYDPQSVACARYLKEQYFKNDIAWSIDQGSVLDSVYLQQYKDMDIVYSWGVLHHTGAMVTAFENVALLVKEKGQLFIAIYNDQGGASRRWLKIKQWYVSHGPAVQRLLCCYTLLRQWTISFIKDLLKTGNPRHSWQQYKTQRGMSPWIDIVDWTGGYPFEVAKPEEVFNFFQNKGFALQHLRTCGGGLGCNEFVFCKK